MTKALTEVARQILMKESNDFEPDRDAKKATENSNTLRPISGVSEPPKKLEGEIEDLGPALTKYGDVPPSAKAAAKIGKDTSDSSQLRKGVGAGEKLSSLNEIELTDDLVEFIDGLVAEGKTEDEILIAIEENFEIDEGNNGEEIIEESEEDIVAEEDVPEYTPQDIKVDVSEHIDALLSGETLSEEFKEKATTIFESAVKDAAAASIKKLDDVYGAALHETRVEIEEEISEKVNSYLDYIVEKWIDENEIAIEQNLKTEITEDFISGLRNLFLENYIDIPEDKVSVVEELANKITSLEERLNEEIETNISLKREINESRIYEAFVNVTDGLTDTQAERLKVLAEGIEYTSAEDYKNKLEILKSSYFTETIDNTNALDKAESTSDGRKVIAEGLTGPMARYVQTLGKKLPN